MSNITNVPRAAIHVGEPAKSFSAAEGYEPERRGWDENTYRLKNQDTNNHYDFSRKHLNFEINGKGQIVPLGSNPVPLHERLKQRLDELGFKPYKDKNNPLGNPDNSPNCTVGIIVSGDHDVLTRLAFGAQDVDYTLKRSNANVCLCHDIKAWAMGTYQWACRRWGAENIIAFDVHNDETTPHIHIQTVPVAKTKTRGRASVKYVHKEDKTKVLSQKEWKKLSEDARRDYVRTEMERREKECVSYARVWGEDKYAVGRTYYQMHTDYYNEVGRKYGLARGENIAMLPAEERRGRIHKNKAILEAERQSKAAIEKAEQYAVLATVDKKEIRFPLLNIETPVQNALKTINEELSIPIPSLFGQEKWRTDRTDNIGAAIKGLVDAFNKARGQQNEGVRTSVNNIYTYYMQNLNRLIKENKALEAENDALKSENAKVKERISGLDENAVKRVAAQKDEVIGQQKEQLEAARKKLTQQTNDYNALLSKYNYLVVQWNELTQQPEIIEAMERVEERKKVAAEAKREEEARCNRHQGTIERFISEGRDALGSFSRTTRTDFNEKEAIAIYYGIIATASKHGLSLDSSKGKEAAVCKFLEGMTWSGCSDFRIKCVANWTNLFATKEVTFSESVIGHFLSFVEYVSCSADTYASLGGSNGCADQLTNWDGTQKTGLGAPTKKKESGLSR